MSEHGYPPRVLHDPQIDRSDKIIRHLKILIVIAIVNAVIFGLILLVLSGLSLWVFITVDFVEISGGFREVRLMTHEARGDYARFKENMPYNMTQIREEVLPQDDHHMAKLVNKWKDGVTGASHVLSRMYELEFIEHATPLITRLSEAAVTDEAEASAHAFGKVVKYVGRRTEDGSVDALGRIAEHITGNITLLVKDPRAQSVLNDLQSASGHIARDQSIRRIFNSTAKIVEEFSTINVDGPRLGESVSTFLNENAALIREVREDGTVPVVRDSLVALSRNADALLSDGINIMVPFGAGKRNAAREIN